jgi:hypothetical protein
MTTFYPADFDQTKLWDDPLKPLPGVFPGAVLVSEEIETYVRDYNLIFDRADFLEGKGKLKGASYTMSPHPNDAWECRKAGSHRPLTKDYDSRGAFYLVPRNSLVFIRLRQKLRLPFYLIGRHNLKISYVYKGLLLGTGPQVDPGYTGRLYIPLHNFTTNDVRVYIDESFVSIDFVRTTPFQLDKKKPVPKNVDDLYATYRVTKRLIPRDKLARDYLDAYLEGSKPCSSLGAFVTKFKKMAREFRWRKYLEYGLLAAVIAIAATYFIGMKSWLTSFVIHYDNKMDVSVTRSIRFESETKRDIKELKIEIDRLRAKIDPTATPSPPPANPSASPSPVSKHSGEQ